MQTTELPFLRPRSSRAARGASSIDPRTSAFRALNAERITAKVIASHDESLLRSNRAHMSASAEEALRQKQQQRQQRGGSAVVVPAPPSHAPRPLSTAHLAQPSQASMRTDCAHLWWPQAFDGVAFNAHLERLLAASSSAAPPAVQDAHNAFDALALVADTLHGTPAAELLRQVRRVLAPLVYRPESGDRLLLRDLVMGLEIELDQLHRALGDTQRAHRQLREAAAQQVLDANAKRVATELGPALASTEVAEATIARVQRESAEMATRLQQSLAQQQIVRAKMVDLSMRNLELRQVLEAQRRAATARNWEDALPKAAAAFSASSGTAEAAAAAPVLDRSALHILGDAINSSQTELANLVEYRQRLSALHLDE